MTHECAGMDAPHSHYTVERERGEAEPRTMTLKIGVVWISIRPQIGYVC